MYILKYESNYADEFDIDGIFCINELQRIEFESAASKFIEGSFCFGTNEEIEYESNKDLLATFTIEYITDEEYDVLYSLKLTSLGYAKSFYNFVIDTVEEMNE